MPQTWVPSFKATLYTANYTLRSTDSCKIWDFGQIFLLKYIHFTLLIFAVSLVKVLTFVEAQKYVFAFVLLFVSQYHFCRCINFVIFTVDSSGFSETQDKKWHGKWHGTNCDNRKKALLLVMFKSLTWFSVFIHNLACNVTCLPEVSIDFLRSYNL